MISNHKPTTTGAGRPVGASTWAFLLALIPVLLLALNLRIPTAALGPLLPELRADTGRGETSLSLLTTLPLALTLVVAPFTPRLAARFGRNRVIACALGGIVAGTAIRSIPGDPLLLAGTVLLGCAIAVGTVLAPATIAAEEPGRRGALTGAYTMALSLGPALALGLGLTIPMMHGTGFDWRATLGLWALGGAFALIVWMAYTYSARSPGELEPQASSSSVPHAKNSTGLRSASVSALTSTVGIAIASLGPLAFGFGLETSGSYVMPISSLAIVVLLQAAAGFRTGRYGAGRPRR